MAFFITFHFVYTEKCLDAEGSDYVRDVLNLNVLPHGVAAEMLSERLGIGLVDIYPVFHVFLSLRCQSRLHNKGVEHGLAFYGQEARVNCSTLFTLIEQLHILSRRVLQKVRGVSAPDRYNAPIRQFRDPSSAE